MTKNSDDFFEQVEKKSSKKSDQKTKFSNQNSSTIELVIDEKHESPEIPTINYISIPKNSAIGAKNSRQKKLANALRSNLQRRKINKDF